MSINETRITSKTLASSQNLWVQMNGLNIHLMYNILNKPYVLVLFQLSFFSNPVIFENKMLHRSSRFSNFLLI